MKPYERVLRLDRGAGKTLANVDAPEAPERRRAMSIMDTHGSVVICYGTKPVHFDLYRPISEKIFFASEKMLAF